MATSLRPLLAEIGRVYAPFLLANASALATRAERVTCTIDGATWTQTPFPYQGKCLRWLREHHATLAAGERAFVDAALAGTDARRSSRNELTHTAGGSVARRRPRR